MAGDRAIRPRHGAHHPHTVSLLELASGGVLLPDAQVELSAPWLHYLGTELFEHPPPSSAELFAVQNLVEHHGSSGHIDGANPRSLPVLLIRDHNPILVYALPCSYPAMESVLPDMGEHVSVGAEEAEDLFQLVWGGMSHVVSTLAGRKYLRQTDARNWRHQTSGPTGRKSGMHPIGHPPQSILAATCDQRPLLAYNPNRSLTYAAIHLPLAKR